MTRLMKFQRAYGLMAVGALAIGMATSFGIGAGVLLAGLAVLTGIDAASTPK